MSEIDYEGLQDAAITLEDEDGSSIECSLQCVFEYNGQDYAVLAEEDNPENEVYFFALDAEDKDDEIEFEFTVIEDEELLNELLEVFQQLADDEFGDGIEVEGLEDPEDGDDDEDDSIWDEFITKKLERD